MAGTANVLQIKVPLWRIVLTCAFIILVGSAAVSTAMYGGWVRRVLYVPLLVAVAANVWWSVRLGANRLVMARCDSKQISFFDGRAVPWTDVSAIRTASVLGSGVQLRLRSAEALDSALPRGPLLAMRFAALAARASPLTPRSEMVRAFWERNHSCGRSWVDMSVAGGAFCAIGWRFDADLARWGRERGLLPDDNPGSLGPDVNPAG